MASCRVYGNKPDTGPGQLSAQAALDDANQVNPTWNATMNWSKDRTVYTSATAGVTDQNLIDYFSGKFPGYNVA